MISRQEILESQSIFQDNLNRTTWEIERYDATNHYLRPSPENIEAIKLVSPTDMDLNTLQCYCKNLKKITLENDKNSKPNELSLDYLIFDKLEELRI